MRDDDDGRPELLPESQQVIVQACAGESVERGEGLVEQRDLGASDECPRDGDPLLLPA